MRPGFKRHELRDRYDVVEMDEDDWHEYCGHKSAEIVRSQLSIQPRLTNWLLNAGAGVYELGVGRWQEVSVDLFTSPIRNRRYSVCTSVENLPFANAQFGAIVCVGEVLAYCDPRGAISEFARVLAPGGLLICDFHSSRSARYWFTKRFGRAADLVVETYNGKPERTWVYDPNYIKELFRSSGLRIDKIEGTHTWSALAVRCGFRSRIALSIERRLDRFSGPRRWTDLMTIVASQPSSAT